MTKKAAKAEYDKKREKPGVCSSCQRWIVWRVNKASGQASPWDKPQPCANEDADCIVCRGEGWEWISHWATCPTADQHRKKRTK